MLRPILTLVITIFLTFRADAECQAVHAKAHGVEVICCSITSPLVSTCEFSSLCKDDLCQCHLIVHKLECQLNSTNVEPFTWLDHSANSLPLSCHQLNLPNQNSSYNVRVEQWDRNRTSSLLLGLCDLDVGRLVLNDVSSEISLVDLSRCMPQLKTLEINLRQQTPVDIYGSFRSLQNLSSLRVVNVDFEFWHSISPWVRSISYVHVENSSLSEIPRWMALGAQLTTLFLKHTRVHSIGTISQLSGLRSAKLSHNGIDDLHKHVLNMKHVYDLDLSENKISSLASHSFSLCVELRVLDLSDNPLSQLPYKPFQRNTKLKWLKLSGTGIKVLTADHFIGLSSLKTLSLSRTSIQSFAPFALLPLKSLRSLDLQAANLTRIPNAVTQNCGLTYLNLADNLLHRGSSLPPEVLVLLSSLSQFRIDGNPLTEFPPSLLLLSMDNHRLYRQLILSTTSLPLWTSEPCTPYYWNMHVRNKSASLRQTVASWDDARMKRDGMEYCREQYEWMLDQTEIYRDLEKNSGCSVTRRLRSAMLSRPVSTCNTSTPLATPLPPPPRTSSVLVVSLVANFFFICLIIGFMCLLFCCSRQKY